MIATVQPNHSFYWRTKLKTERMIEISNWIGSLSKKEKEMLDDIIEDAKQEERWNDN